MKDSLRKFLQLNRLELVVLTVALVLALLTGMIYFHFGGTAGPKKTTRLSTNKEKPAIPRIKIAGDDSLQADDSLREQDKEWATSDEPNSTQQSTGLQGNIDNEGSQHDASQKQVPQPEQPQSSSSSSSQDGKDSYPSNQSSPPPVAANNEKKNIRVTLAIDSGIRKREFPMEVEENGTVFELLKKASSKHSFSFGYSNNAAYGVFVEELDGVSNNPSASKFWLYYVNGKYASLGASSQKISEGDVILWRYENSR